MNNEPGEISKENTQKTGIKKDHEEISKPPESPIKNAQAVLDAMHKRTEEVENRGSLLEEQAGDLNGEQGENIKNKAKELNERTQSTAKRYLESLKMYTRLAILGGVVLLSPMKQDQFQDTQNPQMELSEQNQDVKFKEIIANAKKELAENGITSEQKGAYAPNINDLIYAGIQPSFYEEKFGKLEGETVIPWEKIKKMIPNIVHGRESYYDDINPTREDAWRFYLGMPQENNTFGISDYQPAKSTEANKYYYKINGFWDELRKKSNGDEEKMVQKLLAKCKEGIEPIEPNHIGVMGNYKFSQGEDEKGPYFSYYDPWNLDMIPIEKGGFFGKSYEIYDRYYYSKPFNQGSSTLSPQAQIEK